MRGAIPLREDLPVAIDPITGSSRARWTSAWSEWLSQLARLVTFASFWGVRTETSAYTVQRGDSVILVNGNVTITLPAAFPTWEKRITVKKINGGGGTTTVSPTGFTIDGAASWTTTTQYEAADFVGDGTNVFVV
jgi:hypothetical protein